MNQGYWFKSDLFEISKGEDDETNPGCYGKELAQWLCNELETCGYHDIEVIPEDWGWCVMCSSKDYLLWVGCASLQDEESLTNHDPGSPPQGKDVVWHAFVQIEVPIFKPGPFIKKLIGNLNTREPLDKLDKDLNSILSNNKRIEFCKEP